MQSNLTDCWPCGFLFINLATNFYVHLNCLNVLRNNVLRNKTSNKNFNNFTIHGFIFDFNFNIAELSNTNFSFLSFRSFTITFLTFAIRPVFVFITRLTISAATTPSFAVSIRSSTILLSKKKLFLCYLSLFNKHIPA